MKLLAMLLLGAVFALGGLCFAWRYAPVSTDAADATAIMAAAAESEVRFVGQDTEVVYVSPPEVASTIRVGTRLRIEPWNRRPEDLGCARFPGRVVVAPCDRNDYVQVSVQSFLFWRVAVVDVATHNGHFEKLLVKVGSAWMIVGTRGYVL